VDSIEGNGEGSLGEVLLKETNPIKMRINEAVNRHLILQIHVRLSKQLLKVKTDGSALHVIKDLHKVMGHYLEEGSFIPDREYRTYDETLLFAQI
jgi:hypothetical protein